jgi:hypothetical protein
VFDLVGAGLTNENQLIQPLFGADDAEWVAGVGRYILNMGAMEFATRLLIGFICTNIEAPILFSSLSTRLAFLKKRFPRSNESRYGTAMRTFDTSERHCAFRNIVAHSALQIGARADGTQLILGILNIQKSNGLVASELITLEELRGRVTESSLAAKHLLDMQDAFRDEVPRE